MAPAAFCRRRTIDYEDLVSRDKASLDIVWLRDESLEDAENLPAPVLILQEIMEDLEGALAQLQEMAGDLGATSGTTRFHGAGRRLLRHSRESARRGRRWSGADPARNRQG
ncbi:hypothetical protein AFERRID_19250 [Acidithiobacillus ferridurans]|uniref:Uncharacterized protein n=1 Tax=Acidithiobacillus ferridurans TaxID=1232575 RepID=A0A2Z6ILZ3_ACIFI|nr:hypothetical protein AFERRID_19250 [Acidithiobacillus ferridurans]